MFCVKRAMTFKVMLPQDPDGYWIEIIPQGATWATQEVDCCGVNIAGGPGYTGGGGGASSMKK